MKKRLLPFLALLISQYSVGQTLNFVNQADMITPRGGSSAATTLSHEYIANGFTGGSLYTSQIERYSFADNTWSTFDTSPESIAKCYGNAEQLVDRLYLYNGTTASGLNDKLEIIDLNTGQLTVSGTLNPNPVYNAGSATYLENLLSYGGCISAWNGTYSNKLYKISLSGQWTPLADMPEAFEAKGIVSDGNTDTSKLYVFGGYREDVGLRENFETVATTGNLSITDWINVAQSGTKLFQGKFFGTNQYAQISAFTGTIADQEASNIAWLISPNISMASTENTFLNFDTLDGFDNGATLQAYLITNWTGNIATSSKILLNATISSGHAGYGPNFVNSGSLSLIGAPNNFRIAFKYSGGYAPLATTTYQIDNVRVYKQVKSNKIYIYDFISNTWSTAAAILPLGLSAHSVTIDKLLDQGKIYVSGDYENQTFLGIYDLWTGNFTTLDQTNMIGRRHHTSEIIDNKLYLFGGNTTSDLFSSLSSTQSAELPSMATAHFENKDRLHFYPNPSNDRITLNSDIKSILLYTFEGKTIPVKMENQEVSVSHLSKGIYMVQVIQGNGHRFWEKLIKN